MNNDCISYNQIIAKNEGKSSLVFSRSTVSRSILVQRRLGAQISKADVISDSNAKPDLLLKKVITVEMGLK